MSDDDWLSNVSWPEYTEEDFQEIDRICEESRRDSDRVIHADESASSTKSPFAEFRQRQRGYLTVTDLVAPAWCEVQFDYGLRQLRNRPLEERPKSFVTAQGKEIKVKAKVAARNEDTMDKGNIVHKRLEKEIHKEEVKIKVKTKEEVWALHLFDFLVRLKTIKVTSVVRELPIWGIIQDQPVYGKIDELRLENATNGTESSITQPKDQQTQGSLDSFIRGIRKAARPPSSVLHIIDNKTRTNVSIPSHTDSLPSRLQLMLYWLMLSRALTSSGDGTNFSTFCARIGLRPARKFSETFTTEVASVVVENGLSLHFLDANCLEDMDFPYRETIKEMGLDVEGCVSTRLSLVYRLRGRRTKKPKLSTSSTEPEEKQELDKSQDQPVIIVKEVAEEPDLVTDEDEGSLKLAPPMDGTVDITEDEKPEAPCPKEAEEMSPRTPPETTGETKVTSRKRKRSSKSKSGSQTEAPTDTAIDESGSSSESSTDSRKRPTGFIIGTKKFQYDERLLTAHLSSILAWWHSKRPPHGVSIEDVGRCNTCEYKNGCEWREQKALEIFEKARTKSAAVNAAQTA